MIRRSAATSLARAGSAAFALLTCSYCLLTYNSFAYRQFIRPSFSWLSRALSLSTRRCWLVLAVTALTLLPDLRRGATRLAVGAYPALWCALGVWLSISQVLPLLANNGRSFVLALLALLPPAALALIDHEATRSPALATSGEARLLKTCALTGVFTWLIYAAGSAVRARGAEGLTLSRAGFWLGVAHPSDQMLVLAAVRDAAAAAAPFLFAPPRHGYWLLLLGRPADGRCASVFATLAFTGG